MNILFVCTGNTCRSPIAEAIAKDHFKKINKTHRVLSVGLQNIKKEPASSNSIEALEEWGLDLTRHKSKLVTRDLVKGADLVLTMTIAQRDLLRIAYFDIENIDGKVQTLHFYATGEDQDIEDPYFKDLDRYKQVRDELKNLIEKSNWG